MRFTWPRVAFTAALSVGLLIADGIIESAVVGACVLVAWGAGYIEEDE